MPGRAQEQKNKVLKSHAGCGKGTEREVISQHMKEGAESSHLQILIFCQWQEYYRKMKGSFRTR
jgi:hypothetical protein